MTNINKELISIYPPSLTTLISRPVILNINVFLASLWAGATAQDPRPVDSVMIAELLVSCDVDAAVIYLPQRA